MIAAGLVVCGLAIGATWCLMAIAARADRRNAELAERIPSARLAGEDSDSHSPANTHRGG